MKNVKAIICLLLSLSIFNIQIANASITSHDLSSTQMVSTMEMVNTFDRETVKRKIKTVTTNSEIREKLFTYGITPNEIDKRLASLSNNELMELDQNLQNAQAGGILATILLVILIIYFAQRI